MSAMSMGAQMKVIEAVLRANVSGYTAPVGLAVAQTRALAREVTGLGTTAKKDLSDISTSAGVMGAGMVAAFTIAGGAAMGFNADISGVGAASSTVGGQLDQLRQAALDAGAATVFSAREAAQAETELAKAGVSTADILGGALTGSLNLASAGSLNLARSAEIGANAMSIFGLGGSDMAHIADVLAAGANESATDVDELGQALAQGGLSASQMGVGLEDTVGTLALFAQNALKGSDAGTSMKTMLQRLVPQSAEAADMAKRMGLDFFDADGKFIGMAATAQELKTSLGGLSEEQQALALNTIFGTDAARAAAIMMKEGAAGVREWTDTVNQSGYAADLAAQKNDNLKGDLEQLHGSIDTVLIKGGSEADGVLRRLTQTATGLVNGIGDMPGPLAAAGMGFTGIVGTMLLGVSAAGLIIPKYKSVVDTLGAMGPGGEKAAVGMGKVSKIAGVGIPVVTALAVAYSIWNDELERGRTMSADVAKNAVSGVGSMDAARKKVEEINTQIHGVQAELASSSDWAFWDADFRAEMSMLGSSLEQSGHQLQTMIVQADALSRASGNSTDATMAWLSAQAQAGVVFATTGDALAAYKEEMKSGGVVVDSTAAKLEAANKVIDEQRAAVTALQSKVLGLIDAGSGYQDAVDGIADAQRDAVQAERDVASARQANADAIQSRVDAQDQLSDSLRNVESAQQAVIDAQRALDEAMAGTSVDDELSLEGAQIRLGEAQKRMNDGGFKDDLERRRAALDLRRAEVDLAKVQEQIADRPVKAADDLATAKGRLSDAQSSVEDAQRGVERADRAVQESARQVTDAQLAQTDAIKGVRDAEDDAARAALELHGSQLDVNSAMRDGGSAASDLLDELLGLQGAYPQLAGAIQPYIDTLRTLIALRGASAAANPFMPTREVPDGPGGGPQDTRPREAPSLGPSGPGGTGVRYRPPGVYDGEYWPGGIWYPWEHGGRADGGSVMAGWAGPVNERGPELLEVGGRTMLMMGRRSGRVVPNHDPRTQRILSGHSGGGWGGGYVDRRVSFAPTYQLHDTTRETVELMKRRDRHELEGLARI